MVYYYKSYRHITSVWREYYEHSRTSIFKLGNIDEFLYQHEFKIDRKRKENVYNPMSDK